MIPNTQTNLSALFEGEADSGENLPIVAWDDDGTAMVPDLSTGRLVRVDEFGVKLKMIWEGGAVTTFPAPDGWMAVDGQGRQFPVIAFERNTPGVDELDAVFIVDGRVSNSGEHNVRLIRADAPKAAVTPIRGS